MDKIKICEGCFYFLILFIKFSIAKKYVNEELSKASGKIVLATDCSPVVIVRVLIELSKLTFESPSIFKLPHEATT